MSKSGYIDPVTKRPVVSCMHYAPCPICYKCDRNGILQRCFSCIAGGGSGGRCKHDEKTRDFVIRRENFRIKIGGSQKSLQGENSHVNTDQL